MLYSFRRLNVQNLEIRKITENDYTTVCSLYNNELGIKISQSKFNERVNHILENSKHDIFVAICEESVIAFITVAKSMAIEQDYIKINGIAVKENYQGHGIGSQLISYVENYAKKQSVDLIILNSGCQREKAHIFYENLGFSKSSYCFRKKI